MASCKSRPQSHRVFKPFQPPFPWPSDSAALCPTSDFCQSQKLLLQSQNLRQPPLIDHIRVPGGRGVVREYALSPPSRPFSVCYWVAMSAAYCCIINYSKYSSSSNTHFFYVSFCGSQFPQSISWHFCSGLARLRQVPGRLGCTQEAAGKQHFRW